MMQKKILIIGASGMLGEPIARRLKKKNFPVRIMVRDINKVRDQFGVDYEVVNGDVKDIKSIEAALDGCFGVHINLAGDIEQLGVENVAFAANKIGLKRITYISGTSVAEDTTWFPQTKRKFLAEKAIQASGVPYCIFCPTWFMESLPKFVKDSKAFVFGKQPNLYHFIAADDYARAVTNSYLLEEEVTNKRFFIHGPEGFYFKNALKKYCDVCHPKIRKISTIPYWLSKVIAAIGKNEKMKFVSELMSFFEKAGERGDPKETNILLGQPKISLNKWIDQRKFKSDM
jgi:uncharacterized protein YbjT (DUF2867 family)